jgi:hypothetical protein
LCGVAGLDVRILASVLVNNIAFFYKDLVRYWRTLEKKKYHTAVVVCDEDGAGYTLAELVRVEHSDVGEAALYLWHSSTEEWVVKAGRLPLELSTPSYEYFNA